MADKEEEEKAGPARQMMGQQKKGEWASIAPKHNEAKSGKKLSTSFRFSKMGCLHVALRPPPPIGTKVKATSAPNKLKWDIYIFFARLATHSFCFV